MLKSIYKCAVLAALVMSLGACADYEYYPPVTVTNDNPPAASGTHYGPPSPMPASYGTHYGPPAQPYPTVTVTNRNGSAADSMHYGSN